MRSLTVEEFQEAQQRGFVLKEIPVAIEAIAIEANSNLEVLGLTIDPLRDVYTGTVRIRRADQTGRSRPTRVQKAAAKLSFFRERLGRRELGLQHSFNFR